MAGLSIQYFLTQQDAQSQSSAIAINANNAILGQTTSGDSTLQGFTRWFIDHASNVLPPSLDTTTIYTNGTTLQSTPPPTIFYVYPVRVVYYNSQAGAIAEGSNNIARNRENYSVGTSITGTLSGFTSWIVDHTTLGPSPPTVYTNGSLLPSAPPGIVYFLYPVIPCFLEGSRILCQVDGKEEYLPVETLRPGTLVKTSRDGFKPIELIGKRSIANSGTSERTGERLYKCTTTAYPELTEDLVITGCHSILVDNLTDTQRTKTLESLGKIFVTDKKYRLMAHIDERAEPWASEGEYTVWHFALENADDGLNYGVYANGGLLVESCSIRFLKNRSNMTLL
jgi:hypothetical protein